MWNQWIYFFNRSQSYESDNCYALEDGKESKVQENELLFSDNKNYEMLRFNIDITESIQNNSLREFIQRNYIMKIQSQLGVDFSNTVAKKIGRPSSSKFMNSSDILLSLYKYYLNIDINKLLRVQLKEKFTNLIFREYNYYRSDLFMTEYFRIVKKIPYFFVKNFVTQIYIK